METEKQGLCPVTKIEWVDINPIETKDMGSLMPVTATDQSKELIELLNEWPVSHQLEHNVFRIFILPGGYFTIL